MPSCSSGARASDDRALLAVLGLVEVADRRAVLDPAGPVDRPGRDEQGLDQRRLAGAGVADQHDVADGCRILRRARRSGPSFALVGLLRHDVALLASATRPVPTLAP